MVNYDRQRYKDDIVFKTKMKTAQRKQLQKRRFEAMVVLGMKCVKCGNSDYRVLEFDHINNDGAKERQSRYNFLTGNRSNSGTSVKFWKSIRDRTRTDIQLLCGNCHKLKTWEERFKSTDFFPEFIGALA